MQLNILLLLKAKNFDLVQLIVPLCFNLSSGVFVVEMLLYIQAALISRLNSTFIQIYVAGKAREREQN